MREKLNAMLVSSEFVMAVVGLLGVVAVQLGFVDAEVWNRFQDGIVVYIVARLGGKTAKVVKAKLNGGNA